MVLYNGQFDYTCPTLSAASASTPYQAIPDTARGYQNISASKSNSSLIMLGGGNLVVSSGGQTITTPASLPEGDYYTTAQCDSQFVRAIDLSTLNAHADHAEADAALAVVAASGANAFAAAANVLAAAAMPRTGGTFIGAITAASMATFEDAVTASGTVNIGTCAAVGTATTPNGIVTAASGSGALSLLEATDWSSVFDLPVSIATSDAPATATVAAGRADCETMLVAVRNIITVLQKNGIIGPTV